ncbi:MAG: ABC transporter substrate-binding protein [Desulfobacteraceae bacterium]|nr:MAG: ABC transporter substrate-binding protein [Desulfobacteraceae bacterium]
MDLRKKLFIFLFVFLMLVSMPAAASEKGDFGMAPTLNNGKKWRVAYYEGGEYISYQQFLEVTINGLMRLGWIENSDIPPQKGEQTVEFWKWLANKAKSKYLEFVPDAHYSAKWDDKIREKMAAAIIKRVNDKKDIDLIIAMGTWAGQDLANNKHSTPTLAFSVSDAVGAGIIKSIEDSGFDHFHAQVDPTLNERQIRIFHDTVGFKKLGLAYEDTAAGKSYAALDKVEKVSKERGIEIVHAFTKSDVADTRLAEESVKAAFRELVKKCDAIYVTVQGGVTASSIPELVKITNEAKVPTFSQTGSEEVKYGILMSLSQQEGYKFIGIFNAENMAKVFNGAKPRQLNQIFETPPKIAINIKTAEIIGYNPPVDVMLAADEIYQEIVLPPKN